MKKSQDHGRGTFGQKLSEDLVTRLPGARVTIYYIKLGSGSYETNN